MTVRNQTVFRYRIEYQLDGCSYWNTYLTNPMLRTATKYLTACAQSMPDRHWRVWDGSEAVIVDEA